MGNISGSIRNVLGALKDQNALESHLKTILPPREYKHIRNISVHKQRLIISVDSAAALYQFKLKQEGILNKLKERKLTFLSVLFKIGL